MNRAERIFRLHALLNDKPRPLARLQEELDASRATVLRDLAYMKDFMGAPIEYDRATNGYRYRSTAAGFQLPGLWLNESELYALLASERLLDQMQPGLLSPYVGPLRSRIRALPAHSGHSAASVSDASRLRLRLPAACLPRILPLAGKSVEIDGHRLRIGVPQTTLPQSAVALYAHMVTTRNGQDEDRFDAEIRHQFDTFGDCRRLHARMLNAAWTPVDYE